MIPAIVVAVSAVAQGISSFLGSRSQKKAAREQAEAFRREAAEYMRRSWINYRSGKREQGASVANVVTGFANSGIDLNSGTSLLAVEAINTEFTRQLSYDMQTAKYNEQNILRQGTLMDKQANDYQTMSYLNLIGGAASTASSLYNLKYKGTAQKAE
jgi:hypothetical protein